MRFWKRASRIGRFLLRSILLAVILSLAHLRCGAILSLGFAQREFTHSWCLAISRSPGDQSAIRVIGAVSLLTPPEEETWVCITSV